VRVLSSQLVAASADALEVRKLTGPARGMASAGSGAPGADLISDPGPPEPRQPSMPVDPALIPGLAVHEELGRGAHAVVYRARRYGVDCAVKLMHASGFDDPSALTAFRREAALLACVNHPGVASVHEVGQVHGRPYLVMELVEGETLAKVIGAGRLEEAHALALAADVADALDAAHRAGLTHRDIKPQNIMILPTGRAKLIDFGLAARAAMARATDGNVAGTFAYSAPEQTGMLSRLIDGRSDLYSLGVVLFHCVTGRLPFTPAVVGELLRQHAFTPAPDARESRPDLSSAFAAVIAKLLAKDPDDRYQTGAGLAADLRRLAAGELRPDALGGSDTPAGAVETPLVGRAAELAELVGRWTVVKGRRGGMALVAGPPGVGKSRLVRELLSSAAADAHLTLRGKCSADDPVPLGPIRAAIARHLTELDRLPPAERRAAHNRVRQAAGRGAALLAGLTPALASVLSAPVLANEDRQEQFAVAVATFLAGIAEVNGGGVLCLDDVQWLDTGTRRVLQHLSEDLPRSRLLVVATARDDSASRDAYLGFQADFDAVIDTSIVLRPLDDAAMTRLIGAHLGGAALTRQLTSALVTRSGGNPFTADEYVRAVIDSGLIRPSWGTWELDEGGLDALHLPDNVFDLIVTRVAELGAEARSLLVAAAAVGTRVRGTDLAHICGVDEHHALGVLRLATDRRLVSGGLFGEYTFLHDRIREALLAELDDAARRALHQRIALAMDGRRPDDPDDVYAVARHYELGELRQFPERSYRAALHAARLALANHAPHQTLGFLHTAAAAAQAGGFATDLEYSTISGTACVRTGRYADARVHLGRALAMETEPTRRALLHGLVCVAHYSMWELSDATRATDRALAELGRAMPRNPLVLIVTSVAMALVSYVVKWIGIGRGTATGAVRERLKIEAAVLAFGSQPAASTRQMMLVAGMQFRQLYPVNRIGPGPEYVKAHANMAGVAKLLGLRRLSNRMYRRVSAIATRLGDPRLVAYTEWVDAIIESTARTPPVDGCAKVRRVLSEHGRWLDAQEYFNLVSVLCAWLTQEGHIAESNAWYERARDRTDQVQPGQGHVFALVNAANRAVMGPGEEADRQIDAARAVLMARPDNREPIVNYVFTAMMSAVEQDQLGERFERVAADLHAQGFTPRNTWTLQHQIWVHYAYGRLAQARAASAAGRPATLAAARKAVRMMRRAAANPINEVHYLIMRASYLQIAGSPAKALRLLDRADRRARRLNAPVVSYEASRVRARALVNLGCTGQARQHARLALQIAVDGNWNLRARAVRAEFGLDVTTGRSADSPANTISAAVYRRRLDALQQVSIAAASVLQPRQLAGVALRETIDILGAERAFLFLLDGDTGDLVPDVGRDVNGTELDELAGYGASLVTRVWNTGEPLVVTGAEDGEAYGSRSVVVHGLRSIMVAPLRLKGRMLGVVYLDSRVAKGIFTHDDVDILMAITNHIAVSLETARAAQLEVAVEAARQQRDLAELLRSAMSQVSTTLDPEEVLHRILGSISRALPADVGCLLRRDGQVYTVVAAHGPAPAGMRIEVDALPELAGAAGPILGAASAGPAEAVLPGARSWIAVPLTARAEPVGLLLMGSSTPDTFTDAHLQIVAALAGQGMTAYDNACLFEQVNQLATVDSMTGVANRRHFLSLAGHAFTGAGTGPDQRVARTGTQLTALMLDIDHFKQINDTYGHLVGDMVIEEVGARLRSALREGDLVGRYGGEEFAIVVDAEPEHARELADRLLDIIAATPMQTTAGPLLVTVSIGTARRRDNDHDLGELLGRADAALYRAKEEGRNRVVAA
jgi:eukaryotic-like serine/threonine-protein kinase